MMQFSHIFWRKYFHQPKHITAIPYQFISTLSNACFDFDVSVTSDVAVDVANIKRDFYLDINTILSRIELTIWTIYAFRVLNSHP